MGYKMPKRILLLSNSTNSGEERFQYAKKTIKKFLGSASNILLIPYAGININFENYASLTKKNFGELGYNVESIHMAKEPFRSIKEAGAILVGGGNTYALLHRMHESKIVNLIREEVNKGKPYIGWSAGSNVACPTIKTSNDWTAGVPKGINIVRLDALRLVPFQLNPHYKDPEPIKNEESNEDRILEFMTTNPGIYIVGLRNGSILRIEGKNVKLIGEKTARIFRSDMEPFEQSPGKNLDYLLQNP